MSAISKLCIPDGTIFAVVTKGIGTNIYYETNGKQVEAFDTPDEDNVKKVQQELLNPASQAIGIRNVSRRIQLTYGPEYGLSIDSIQGQGSTVIVTLPCLHFDSCQNQEKGDKKDVSDLID